jgi:AraC family transcriptional regulator, transcriptional activator of pobA
MNNGSKEIANCNLVIQGVGIPGGCYAGRMEEYTQSQNHAYSRRNFYKISLLTKGKGILNYADHTVTIKNPTLVFINPMISYSYESFAEEKERGFFCLFTDEFINGQLRDEHIANSPLFKVGGTHTLIPDDQTSSFLVSVFERLTAEAQSLNCKAELLRAYIQLIIHEALKVAPPQNHAVSNSASVRLTDLFLHLLDSQFLNLIPGQGPELQNAQEYAAQLSVHPNHLNRVLKAATGKSTTAHITERLMSEARTLLLHGEYNIAEIAYSLGFNHASNFQIFFKRHTGLSANSFRKLNAANS